MAFIGRYKKECELLDFSQRSCTVELDWLSESVSRLFQSIQWIQNRSEFILDSQMTKFITSLVNTFQCNTHMSDSTINHITGDLFVISMRLISKLSIHWTLWFKQISTLVLCNIKIDLCHSSKFNWLNKC